MRKNKVHLPFNQHRGIFFSYRLLCFIKAIQHSGFMEDFCFRAVYILRLFIGIFLSYPRKNSSRKSDDFPRVIGDRKHYSSAKSIVISFLAFDGESRFQEMLRRKSFLLKKFGERAPFGRSVPKTEILDRFITDTSLDKILMSLPTCVIRAGFCVLSEVI